MKKVFVLAVLGLFQGCAPSSYLVKKPSPSNIPYHEIEEVKHHSIVVNDLRAGDDKKFSYGTLNADLILENVTIDPIRFLKKSTELEFLERGLPVSFDSQNSLDIDVKTLVMKNHRINGFSPFVTFTYLKANLEVNGIKEPISVFIRRGKVPVWSFDEVIQPTLNEPLSLLVKEFAAKINSYVYRQKISNEDVESLISKINENGSYLDVYQLGFGNNLKAIPFLKELTTSKDEYKRQAAISSLGILDAEDEIELLKALYKNGKSWSDKAMALKAIGDLGIDEGDEFLKKEQSTFASDPKKYWVNDLVNLYL